MKSILMSGALALLLTSAPALANSFHVQAGSINAGSGQGPQLWLIQGNGNGKGNGQNAGKGNGPKPKNAKGNGHGKSNVGDGKSKGKPGKGHDRAGNGGKPDHAGGPKNIKKAVTGNSAKGNGRRAFTDDERRTEVKRISSISAPSGRDMALILGGSALGLASPQLLIAETPQDELITYRNCPPGLAKKDPPCVPPGLAKNGVSYDEWASYDDDRYDDLWIERREEWLRRDREIDPNPDLLLLQSDEIEMLYDLDPAPEGQRYGLIDGMPVLLDDQDYRSLLLVNQMARVTDRMVGAPVAPTAALTQDELVDFYRLPRPGADQNYAVVNGQLVELNDSDYELLQLIRVARAIL